MIKNIDQDEKVLDSIYTHGGKQESWLLTEDGLYEVLMMSRKPIAKQFNKLAVKEGFLEEKMRTSSNHNIKTFKSVTKKGERFGENQVCPSNPKETQPSWYEDKFDELLKILLGE